MSDLPEKIGPLRVKKNAAGRTLAYDCLDKFIHINDEVIRALKKKLNELGHETCRICLHAGPDDSSCHEMLILQKKGIAPYIHKHFTRSESYQILEGSFKIEIYDDAGKVKSEIVLGTGEKENLICRIPPETWHNSTPITDEVVFKETRMGPFDPKDSVAFKDYSKKTNS